MTTSIGDTLAQYKIIPVLVLEDLESGLRRCELLCECGLPVAEITFRTKAAESIIREASRRFPEMFIGAGTIIVTGRRQVKGLTTAAGLWASAIVGLACGAGFVECAIFATAVILFAEIVLIKFEFKFAKSSRLCTLYIEYTKPDTIQTVLEMMSERSLKVSNLEVSRTQGEDEEHRYYALLSVQTTPKLGGTELVPAITALPNVFAVEEM